MEHTNASTDELVSEYTSARHMYILASGDRDAIDQALEAQDNAAKIEDALESRGVSVDKLRDFWSNYAQAYDLRN